MDARTAIAGPCPCVTLGSIAGSDGGVTAAIALLQLRHSEYRGLQRSRVDMQLRVRGICKWIAVERCRRAGLAFNPTKFPAVTPDDVRRAHASHPRLVLALKMLKKLERDSLKELIALAGRLPVARWVVTEVFGVGLPSLAAIIGEAGDLANYATVAKLWKRFSLHVIDGKAARRARGAASQGFVPRRRAIMHNVGMSLLRMNGPHAALYRERKLIEASKPGADKGLIHRRALRYIEKRFLRDLWLAWRRLAT